MSEEYSAAKILGDAIYSFETYEPAIKILLVFIIAGLLLIIVKRLLKAIVRFIRRITH